MKALFLALTLGLFLEAHAQHDGLIVSTQQGPVFGTRIASGVRRFLGIPFAVSKRWETPQVPPRRKQTFIASQFGPSCPQAVTKPVKSLHVLWNLTGYDDSNIEESEDCLSVNVWTPAVNRKQATAVLVWIYGGGFQLGTSNATIYDGQSLVQNFDDLSVVTFNYRLNIFGQPNAPQLFGQSLSQNFGLLDINAAIQWVYDNIASFGGDPQRIVLFGESAGGIAIDAISYAYPQDRRIKGIIQQSGNLQVGFTGATNSTFDPSIWNTVASTVGCGAVNGYAQLACLKAIPFKTLTDAVVSKNLSFFPVADGSTIFTDTRSRAEAGNFSRVPLLSGTTADEADIFVVGGQLLASGHATPILTELTSDTLTQLSFACPTAQTIKDRVNVGVPSWRYLYRGVFPSFSPRPDLRSYHSSEVPLVFGTYPTSSNDKTMAALSNYMQGLWVAFARDPEGGLTNYGWPLYNPNTPSLGQLGGFYNKSGVSFVRAGIVDATCSGINTLAEVLDDLETLLGDAAEFII